jgi:hypothetical protein
MTDLYVPRQAGGFEFCHPERSSDFQTIKLLIDGTPRGSTWRPISMRLIDEEHGESLARSDSPWLGPHALIFREAAIEVLGPMLREYGELPPLSCADAKLYVFNATRVVDALDEQASSIARFSSGRIMYVSRYAFRPESTAGIEIFKIPNLLASPTFVSGRFVQLWTTSGLRGLVFKKVWPA